MLLAPTLEQHYTKLSHLFSHSDVILDVGGGPDKTLEKWMTQHNYIISSVDVDYSCDHTLSYTCLSFQESIGYLTLPEVLSYITPNIKKIVIKDFISTQTSDSTDWDYDFSLTSTFLLPYLESIGFIVVYQLFAPDRTRWLDILKQIDVPYVHYPNIHNCLMLATRN